MRTRCGGVQVRIGASGAVTFVACSARDAPGVTFSVARSTLSHGELVCFLVCRGATSTCYEASRRRSMKCLAQPLETFPGVPRVQLCVPCLSELHLSELGESGLAELGPRVSAPRQSELRSTERRLLRRAPQLGSVHSVARRNPRAARHYRAVTSRWWTAGAVTVLAQAAQTGPRAVRSRQVRGVRSSSTMQARAGSVA